MASVSLVLASGSPARLRLLQSAGVEPMVVVSDVDEGELEREYVAQRGLGQADSAGLSVVLAQAKALAVVDQLASPSTGSVKSTGAPPTLVTGVKRLANQGKFVELGDSTGAATCATSTNESGTTSATTTDESGTTNITGATNMTDVASGAARPAVGIEAADSESATATSTNEASATTSNASATGTTTANAEATPEGINRDRLTDQTVVVGADTILEFRGTPMGKPGDSETATKRLREMSGGHGILHTGHCVVDLESRAIVTMSESTVVRFAKLSDKEISAYVATGEPLHVAGSFTIDGIGSAFVAGIEGNFTNVVGLSIPLLRQLVGELGYNWIDFWSQ